jgi:PAS domain S-box-containing protein
MAIELRKSGIGIVGDIPWGSHFCYFYETKQDLLDLLIPYFKTGLENKEFCLWVISNSELLTVAEATSALRSVLPDLDRHVAERSIEIVGHNDWFLSGDTFDPHAVANRFREKLNEALARGYAGMRVNGSPAWLHYAAPKELRKFEAKLDKLFPNQRTIASCTYPLTSVDGEEVFDVVRTHQFAIAKRQGEWEIIETPELIQAKAEIERLNEELEQRVVERTNELRVANEELTKEIAERKQAEALLHAKEQEFRAIVENAPDQIIRYDRDFRRTYVNPAVAQFYGLPAETLIGKPLSSDVPEAGLVAKEDELAQVRQRIAAVFNTGETFDYELTWTMPTGQRLLSIRLFPELDLNGAVVNVLGISRDITERRKAEDELKKEKEILDKIFDNIPVMIGFVGDDGVKLVNPEWERTIGWTLKELQEENVDIFAEAYPDPQYRQEVLDFVAAATGEWADLNIKVRDGRVIEAACAVVRLSDGTKVAIAQDITERKQAEDALRRSEDHLRLVLDTTPALIHTGRPDGYLDYFNQRWLKYVGRSLEELQGWGWTATIHPDDVEGIVNEWRASLASGEPFLYEARVRQADGEYRWMLHRKVPLRDEHGNIVSWHGSSIDIEDRKQAEEKLRRSESQLAEAQRLAHVGSWDWDLRSNTVTWSDELYRIFGLQPGEINVAGDAMSFIHPEDRELVMSTVQSSVKNKEPYSFYYRALRPDGDVRIVHSRGHIVSDEDGNTIRVFGATQDVTELKRAEEKLKSTSAQLRALSARIHSAKEEEGTRIARELHDELGSALTSLRWSLDEIESVLSASATGEADIVREKIAAMTTLIQSTLQTVRRISSELRPGILDEVGLIGAIEWEAQQFEARTGILCYFDAREENVRLTREQSTALFRIFQETLTNVLRHAKATRVDIAAEEREGEFVLTIKDNGRGIIDAEKSGEKSLGLLGMRERAYLIGGEVNITGVAGRGTVVTVRVPVPQPSTAEE